MTLTQPAQPLLTTIPNVEICEVGEEWELSTGPLTIEPEHIEKFLAGVENDPAVKSPRVRFGHTDEWPVASEPSFGVWTNLRAENDGMTLVGDLAGVPEWFKDIAAAAWPNRSLDGYQDAVTHTGNEYPLLITAVSFLGVVLPGINTLEDLAAVWAAEPPEGTEVKAGTPVHATRGGGNVAKPAAAAVGTSDLAKAFYEDFAEGDRYWWWIRQTFLDPTMLIVDDDEGGLWAVTYTITSTDEIEFGEPEQVVTQYVYKDSGAVAACAAQLLAGKAPDAVYENAVEARPQERNKEASKVGKTKAKKSAKASTATVDRDALLKRLGLPEDATEEDITAALAEEQAPDEEPDEQPDEQPDDESADEGDEENDDEGDDDEEADPTSAATATRTVPKKELDDMQRRLAAHDKREQDREKKRRDGVVNAAVKEGRIARAHAKAWRTKLDVDTEGTEKLLTASEDKGGLPKNLVPVNEQGADEGAETVAAAHDDAQEAYYATHFPELATAGGEK